MEGKKLKVLVIAFYFSPSNTIGAIRPTKFAKYLSMTGKYEITVLCARPFKTDIDISRKTDLNYVHNIISVNQECIWWKIKRCLLKIFPNHESNFSRRQNVKEINTGLLQKVIMWVKERIRASAEWLNEKVNETYFIRAKKSLLQLNCEYDLIYSTCGPLSSHELAYTYKEKYPNSIWIADFRDPLYEIDYKFCGRKMSYLEVEKMISKSCECMVGVVDTCIHQKELEYKVLNNGFDLDDLKNVDSQLWTDKKFHIVYTGRLYPRSDARPLFQSLRELSDEGEINIGDFEFDYAGTTFFRLVEQAKEYSVEDILYDMGIVSHEKALSMQESSQLLVLLTWNDQKSQNILSGKVYEYMFSGRPVLGIVSGEMGNSGTSQMIKECRLGHCYEEVSEEGISQLKKYIKLLYDEYMESGNTSNHVNWDKVNENSYENRARVLEKIIQSQIVR